MLLKKNQKNNSEQFRIILNNVERPRCNSGGLYASNVLGFQRDLHFIELWRKHVHLCNNHTFSAL